MVKLYSLVGVRALAKCATDLSVYANSRVICVMGYGVAHLCNYWADFPLKAGEELKPRALPAVGISLVFFSCCRCFETSGFIS